VSLPALLHSIRLPQKSNGGQDMYYKNSDYTARTEMCDGEQKYFIQFHGQVEASPVIEVERDIFLLYMQEFRRPLDRQRNERRRHLSEKSLEEALAEKARTSPFARDLEEVELWCDVEVVLKGCTPSQERRFRLFAKGYSFAEISVQEGCTERAIRKSVGAVKEKVKRFFAA